MFCEILIGVIAMAVVFLVILVVDRCFGFAEDALDVDSEIPEYVASRATDESHIFLAHGYEGFHGVAAHGATIIEKINGIERDIAMGDSMPPFPVSLIGPDGVQIMPPLVAGIHSF